MYPPEKNQDEFEAMNQHLLTLLRVKNMSEMYIYVDAVFQTYRRGQKDYRFTSWFGPGKTTGEFEDNTIPYGMAHSGIFNNNNMRTWSAMLEPTGNQQQYFRNDRESEWISLVQ